MTKKIAIVGSGISGLSAAYILSRHFDVTLFEKDNRLGGHAHTAYVNRNDQTLAIDTGFIVFNRATYPYFCKLLANLSVDYISSSMSFSFSAAALNLEYSGNNLRSIFAQKSNLFKLSHYKLLRDILRFNRAAATDLKSLVFNKTHSLSDWLAEHRLNGYFYQVYLQPMIAAIWSTPPSVVEKMSAYFVLAFFENHGLLRVSNQLPWYTVKGGSISYVEQIQNKLHGKYRLDTPVLSVSEKEHGVSVKINNDDLIFDYCILACHSDEALAILDNPTVQQQEALQSIRYQTNDVVLHQDATLMPKRKSAWASWNYLHDTNDLSTLTYYANQLQQLDTDEDFFVTVNKNHEIDPNKIIANYTYSHPVLDQVAVQGHKAFDAINQGKRIYFCGAYWGNGFHEDGISSAVKVCNKLGIDVDREWNL